MANVVNPRMELRIFGSEEFIIPNDYYMTYDIDKDQDEEPNEADLIVNNLDEDMRNKLSQMCNESAPIEIHLTPSGIDELVQSFIGEINEVEHVNLRTNGLEPGYETIINCTSQLINHRSIYVDRKTFSKGTPIDTIVQFFVDKLSLPVGNIDALPTVGILISQSFSGPAYQLLQRYVFDLGMYAYILDGKLFISNAFEQTSPTVVELDPDYLRVNPRNTMREDSELIEMRTVIQTTNYNPDPFKKVRKKKTKETKVIGKNDYVSYTATDKTIEGVDFKFLLQPHVQPNDIIHVPYQGLENKLFRVREVYHTGNNETFSEWDTDISADLYDDSSGDLLAGIL